MGKAAMSYAPLCVLVIIMILFYVVSMVALVPPLIDTAIEVPRDTYYAGSDIVNIVVLQVLYLLTIASFLQAAFTRPGAVPKMYPFDPQAPASPSSMFSESIAALGHERVLGIERKHDGRARFCRTCGTYKPDRTHHSNNITQCVLEMDHYCPWIRNCVGYYNKKFFFLLIFYGACSFIAFTVALGPRFVASTRHVASALDFFVVFTWILGLLLGVALAGFFLFHTYLMLNAYTTIEFFEKRRADESKRNAQGVLVRHLYETSPYHLGVYRNVCHVLGPWYVWLIPTRLGMSNEASAGCVYESDPDHPLVKALSDREANTVKMTKDELDAADTCLLEGVPQGFHRRRQ